MFVGKFCARVLLPFLALGVLAPGQDPPLRQEVVDLAAAKMAYEEAAASVRLDVLRVLEAKVKDLAASAKATSGESLESLKRERARFIDGGQWPGVSIPTELHKNRWDAAREALAAAFRAAWVATADGDDETESKSLRRDKDVFWAANDLAGWREFDRVDPGKGPRAWSVSENAYTSALPVPERGPVDPLQAFSPLPNGQGELRYRSEMRVRRTAGSGGLTLTCLDSQGNAAEFGIAGRLLGPQRPAASGAEFAVLSVWVHSDYIRIDIDGIAVLPRNRAGLVADAQAADPGSALIQVLPERGSQFSIAGVRWKPLDVRLQAGGGPSTPGATSVESAAGAQRSLLAAAREEYSRALREVQEGVETALEAKIAKVKSESKGGDDRKADQATKSIAAVKNEERPQFRDRGAWPAIPERPALSNRWESARNALADAYDREIGELSKAPGDPSEAAGLKRDRDAFRSGNDLAEWRPIPIDRFTGVGEKQSLWLGQSEVFKSRDVGDEGRAPTALGAEFDLPSADVQYMLEFSIERQSGTGGFTLRFQDSSRGAIEYSTSQPQPGALGRSSPSFAKPTLVTVVVCNGYARVDCDYATVFRPLQGSPPADAGPEAIEFSITPERNTTWTVRSPRWKPIGSHRSASRNGGAAPASSRESEAPRSVLRKRSPAVDKAILDGMRWLIRHQKADGSWSPAKLKDHCMPDSPCLDPGDTKYGDEYDEGVTSLAVLCFLEYGWSDESKQEITDTVVARRSTVGDVVGRGLQWLVSRQEESGQFTKNKAFMYNEALATMALAKAYALTHDERWRLAAQRGLEFVQRAQRPNPSGSGRWGWRYVPRECAREALSDSDTSVTTWCVRALEAGVAAGLDVDDDSLAGALDYISFVTAENGRVGYLDPKAAGATVTGTNDHFKYHSTVMSALGMCARLLIARNPNDSVLAASAKRIVEDLPTVSKDRLSVDYYYWHEGTLALDLFDGPDSGKKSSEYWTPWKTTLLDALLSTQNVEESSCHRGGWIILDRWSYTGGPVYTTAINVLTLELVTQSKRN